MKIRAGGKLNVRKASAAAKAQTATTANPAPGGKTADQNAAATTACIAANPSNPSMKLNMLVTPTIQTTQQAMAKVGEKPRSAASCRTATKAIAPWINRRNQLGSGLRSSNRPSTYIPSAAIQAACQHCRDGSALSQNSTPPRKTAPNAAPPKRGTGRLCMLLVLGMSCRPQRSAPHSATRIANQDANT